LRYSLANSFVEVVVLKSLTLIPAFCALLFCGGAHAATEAQLIAAAKREGGSLHASSNFLPYGRLLVEEFQRKYPFVTVKHTQFAPTIASFTDFFEAENPEDRFDIMLRCQDKDLDQWVQPREKLLASLSGLPNWAKRPRRFHNNERYIFFLGSPHVVAYNPEHIAEADLPASYDELLLPKWRGKVAVRSPLKGNSAAFWTHYIMATRGADWLKTFGANNPHVAQSALSLHQLVQDGTYKIGLSRDVEVLNDKRYPNLKFRTIRNEVPMQYQLGVMFRNAPHPATARLFMNWLISDEATRFLESKGYTVGQRHEQVVSGKTWHWNTYGLFYD